MQKTLEGKVALIIGASSGIGEGAVEAIANHNPHAIYIAARREEFLINLAGKIKDRYGVNVIPIVTDITQTSQLDHLFQTILKDNKALDYVVNAAGLIQKNDEALTDMPDERIRLMVETNLTSVMQIGKRVVQIFQRQGSGVYVILSSEAGIKSYDNYEVYSATKAGVSHFARSLNETFVGMKPKTQAYVFALCPGLVDTPEARLNFPDAREETWKKAPNGLKFSEEHIIPAIINPHKHLTEKGVVIHIPTVNF